MFSTLENNGESSAQRGTATLTSFTIQGIALSMLLAVPLLTTQGPPKLQWIRKSILSPPSPPEPEPPRSAERRSIRRSNVVEGQIVAPSRVPDKIEEVAQQTVAASPNIDDASASLTGATGTRGNGVMHSFGEEAVAPAAPHIPARPIKNSHWAEGNLIFRVQPLYPALARAARIQGTVELRAIIGKTGTIENLVVASGHPMLVKSAIDAVRQWRYRPYLLNGEPVEVETQITVNFLLEGR